MHKYFWAIAMTASITAYALQPVIATAAGVTMNATPIAGSEAISVRGNAPPGSPVTITLLATFSPDLPTVVVSRHVVQPDASGNYQARIAIAAAFERGTLLRVFAASAGGTSAPAQLIVGPPNGGVLVPLDTEPSSTKN